MENSPCRHLENMDISPASETSETTNIPLDVSDNLDTPTAAKSKIESRYDVLPPPKVPRKKPEARAPPRALSKNDNALSVIAERDAEIRGLEAQIDMMKIARWGRDMRDLAMINGEMEKVRAWDAVQLLKAAGYRVLDRDGNDV